MKSTSFKIKNIPSSFQGIQTFSVPLLDAYAIEYSIMNINGQSCYMSRDEVVENRIIWNCDPKYSYEIISDDSVILEIFYHGIRDYSLFFPQMIPGNPDLAKRLGEYYEESEKAFDNSAWLSYALMCGGIFEGLLLHENIAGSTFFDKIERAQTDGIIDDKQARIMHTAREARNIIHANKFAIPYILRKEAMDMRTTMDVLIKDFAGC